MNVVLNTVRKNQECTSDKGNQAGKVILCACVNPRQHSSLGLTLLTRSVDELHDLD